MEGDSSGGDQSLIALATKLAQVQFRLRQLSRADEQTRELLLKDLEKFAFDNKIDGLSYDTAADSEEGSTEYQQRKIIEHLKQQVDQLERECAKSTSKEVVNEHLSVRELKNQLGSHLASLVSREEEMEEELGENGAVIPKLSPPPLKLGTKGSVPKPFTPPIRHVHFEISSSVDLKEDIPDSPKERKGKETVTTPTISADKLPPVQISGNSGEHRMSQQLLAALGDEDNEDGLQERGEKDSLWKKSLVAVETTVWLCGSALGRMVTCSSTRALSPPATETNQLRHDIKHLEEIVSGLVTITDKMNTLSIGAPETSQMESDFRTLVSDDLVDTLGSLLEHGLDKIKCVPDNARKGEFSVKMSGGMKGHWAVWKVFQEFYRMKGGDVHSSVPLHKLSSSFSLPVENGLPPKKSLLTCIHKAEKVCEPVPPTEAPSLKLCYLLIQGFNIGYLKEWLHSIVTTEQLIENFYHGYSFVSSAGFRPAFPQLERLKRLSPHPVINFHIHDFISSDAFLTS